MNNTVGETAGVTQDVGSDPTVGPPDFCVLCGECICCDFCGEVYCKAFLVAMGIKGELRGGHSVEVMRMDVTFAEDASFSESFANSTHETSAAQVKSGVS
jgi:hypothetical protein